MTLADVLVYIGGIFLMVSFLPQVVKSYQTRQTKDLSMLMLVATFLSSIFYEAYAIILTLTPVVIMNGIFTALITVKIGMKWHYDRNDCFDHLLT